jgi:thiol-disulfide isomerase/thioredoxin
VLLDFWATWCAPCVAELPNVRKIHEKYGGEDGDLVVIGCSLDSEDEIVGAFIKKKDINWTQIVAGPADKNPIAQKYFVEGIPATFLIDPEGRIVAKDLRGRALQTEVDRLIGKMRQSKSKGGPSKARATK